MRTAMLAVVALAPGLMLLGQTGPVIFFTDLTSGPSVAANGDGVFVSIYGRHFGDEKADSYVTVGGVEAAGYALWSDRKIVIRLGPQNPEGAGQAVKVVRGGSNSNDDVSFTIRDNGVARVFFIDPAAPFPASGCADSKSDGSAGLPWGVEKASAPTTRTHSLSFYAGSCLKPGDTVYIRAGVYSQYDGFNWGSILLVRGAGTAERPIALVAYPGETVVLDGSQDGRVNRATIRSANATWITLAGFRVVGNAGASSNGLGLGTGGRIIGNLVTGPNTCQYDAIGGSGTDLTVLGNEITDVGTNCNNGAGPTKLMHSIYLSAHNVEVAWNYIHGNKTFAGIQIHSDSQATTGGYTNLLIHSNWIEDAVGGGINLSTIDFGKEDHYIRIYNNVLLRNGRTFAYDEAGGTPHYCIALKGFGRADAAGVVEITHNTLVDCTAVLDDQRAAGNNVSAALSIAGGQPGVSVNFSNNIVQQREYRYEARLNVFCTSASGCERVSGSGNIWSREWSANPALGGTAGAPGFVDPERGDFQLARDSIAISAGVPTRVTRDIVGHPRLDAKRPSAGAFEFAAPPAVPAAPPKSPDGYAPAAGR